LASGFAIADLHHAVGHDLDEGRVTLPEIKFSCVETSEIIAQSLLRPEVPPSFLMLERDQARPMPCRDTLGCEEGSKFIQSGNVSRHPGSFHQLCCALHSDDGDATYFPKSHIGTNV
ncbi:hypothetical protein, partial [Mesorhizobium sp.]|uniref:hypothetical protein n=1 Tax=Mesorhizobium sp. TaxID=1871066 RepID=UPI0025C734F2